MKQWINWKSVSSTIAGAIILAMIGFGWKKASAEYAFYVDLKERSPGFASQQDVMQMQRALEELTFEIRTVSGWARVQESNSVSECCMRINTSSVAAKYANEEKARVTNLSHPDRPSTVVNISGTYRNSDREYLAVLSELAGNRIEAEKNSQIDIIIQPIEK